MNDIDETEDNSEIMLYQSLNSRVLWLPKHRTIFKEFRGFIMGGELQEAFDAGLAQLQQMHGKKWLSDNRQLPVYRPQDIEWINTDWFPRMLGAGWKYWALLEPESEIGAFVMKKFQFYADNGIILEVFHHHEAALRWLDEFDD